MISANQRTQGNKGRKGLSLGTVSKKQSYLLLVYNVNFFDIPEDRVSLFLQFEWSNCNLFDKMLKLKQNWVIKDITSTY